MDHVLISGKCLRWIAAVAAVAAVTSVTACDAEANDDGGVVSLRYASYLNENATDSKVAEWWFERVDELTPNYTVEVERFYSASLLPAEDTLPGIADGRADMGSLNTPYHPSELPLSQLATVPFVADSPEATARAFADLYGSTPAFEAEYERQGVIPLVWGVTANDAMGFPKPVSSIDDLQGLRIRAQGFRGQALAAIGANGVALAAPDIYESVELGTIDGWGSLPLGNAVTSFLLNEVAPHVVDAQLGQFALFLPVVMNQEVWTGLPEEVQDAMQQAAAEAFDVYVDLLDEQGEAACQAIEEAGGSITTLPDAEVEAWRTAVLDDLVGEWRDRAVDTGLNSDEVNQFYESFVELHSEYAADAAPDMLVACSERLK